MIKAFKYRIYPTDDQKVLISKHFGHCRWVYNWGLSVKQNAYKDTGNSPSKFDLSNMLPSMKKHEATMWLREVNAQSLQASLENLDMAFNAFFNKRSAFPKFKTKNDSRQSFIVPSDIRIDWINHLIWLPKFKSGIKIKLSRCITGRITKSTVSMNASGEYYISILANDELELPHKQRINSNTDVIGIDVGVKNFAVCSDGEVIENQKFLRTKQKRLTLLQRKLSHKKKGSNNRKKAKLNVAKLHQKIVNQRTDFLHKLSTRLVRENQAIAREDLDVKGMLKTHKLAKSIGEVAWNQFDSMLKYKTDWHGKWFLQIGRFDASSKTCNVCGHYNGSLTLRDRKCTCPECGTAYDRDHNAALNIRDWAYISYNKNSVPTGSGEFKSVSSKEDKQRNTRKRAKVSAGQKEVTVRSLTTSPYGDIG